MKIKVRNRGKIVGGVFILVGLLMIAYLYANDRFDMDEPSSVTTYTYSTEDIKAIPLSRVKSVLAGGKLKPLEGILKVNDGHGLPVDTPIDWAHGFGENRNVNYQLHAWHMVDNLLRKYDSTKDRKHLESAYNIAIDWVNSNTFNPKHSQDVNMAWYDMAVGVRAHRLAYLIDVALRQDVGTNSDTSLLWRSLSDHLLYLKDENNIAYNSNHGLYQAAGQLSVAQRFQDVSREFSGIKEHANNRFDKMLDLQFTDEGIHTEHSPGYHRMIYATVLNMRNEGLIGRENDSLIAKAGDAVYWMADPDGIITNFGDTHHYDISGGARHLNNPQSKTLSYYLTNGVSGEKPGKIMAYKESGFAAVKTKSGYLSQQAAFHSLTHKHADNLTFNWYDKGQEILIDSGQYGYIGRTKKGGEDYNQGFNYSNPKRQYVEKTRAHNTVEIDGKDFARRGAKPFGSAIENSGIADGVYYILTRTKELGGVEFERLLMYRPEDWLIVVDNLLDDAGESHNFKQWFHFSPDLRIDNSGAGFTTMIDQSPLTITSIVPNTSSNSPVRGQIKPHYQGWHSPQLGEFEPNTAISFEKSGSKAQFITVFSFHDDTPRYITSTKDTPRTDATISLNAHNGASFLSYGISDSGEITISYK